MTAIVLRFVASVGKETVIGLAKKYAYFNFNVYRKILLFYFLLVICTVFIIATTLYYLFSNSSIREISQSSQARLTQTSYASELIYEKVSSLANILNNDPQIVDVMYADRKNPVDEFNAKTRLATIASAYPFIKYMGIYNQQTDRYITDQGVPAFDSQDGDLLDAIDKGSLTGYITFMPRNSTFFVYNASKSQHVLAYIIRPDYHLNRDNSAYIIIHVDESYILNLIHSLMNHNADNIFVMDADGTVLSNTNPDLFLTNISGTPYIDSIMSDNRTKGYFTNRENGERQLITYVKSSTLHWYFVSVQPYDQLISDITKLRNVTLLIASLLIIVSAVFSTVFLRDLYGPISALVEKVRTSIGENHAARSRYNEFEVLSEAFAHTMNRANTIESSYNKSYHVFKETYLHYLMEGKIENVTIDDKMLVRINEELNWPYFCALVFRIDNYASFKNLASARNQILTKFAVCNISKEMLESHLHCQAIDMGKDQVGALLCLSENALPPEFKGILTHIQRTLESLYKVSLTVSIGDVISSKAQIPYSYSSALEYSNYRLIFGHRSIIDYGMVKDQLDHHAEYPYKLEKKIIEAVESPKPIEASLDLFMAKISELSFQHTYFYCHQLIASIYRNFSNVLDGNAAGTREYFEFINRLKSMETLREIGDFLLGFCYEIRRALQENKNKSYYHKIEEAEKYLQENYSNPNISLEFMADMAEVSPGYFGKIFRSVNNSSFNEYLYQLRLDRARRLLIETNDPVNAISEKVGILNSNYFFTLFKKAYGITPAQYRKHPEKLLPESE